MKTKSGHTAKYAGKKNHDTQNLYFKLAQLKNLYRQGWLERDVDEKHCESVAEHSFLTALIAYITAKEKFPRLNADKILKLAVFHELGEIYAGDITPRHKINPDEKQRRETEAVKKVFKKTRGGNKYFLLWQEYEKQKTPEAKFVKEMDKLEMALQASLYGKMGYKKLEEFYDDAERKISSEKLKKILHSFSNTAAKKTKTGRRTKTL